MVIQCDHYASSLLQTATYLFYYETVLLLWLYDTDDVATEELPAIKVLISFHIYSFDISG